MTDEFTRFTAGEIITSKAVATKAFMQHSHWAPLIPLDCTHAITFC